jgi:hypothetical protein
MSKLNAYKVEITETIAYTFDIEAKTEEEAQSKGHARFIEESNAGTLHYYETGDPETNTTIYNVTGTDDDPRENN